MCRLLLIILFILLINLDGYSQYYIHAQDAASIKWSRIEADCYTIIFSKDFENEAYRIANILDSVCDKIGYSLNNKPRKISLVLHSKSASSSAFVSWAPARTEWTTTPHQANGTGDWLEQLAVHESRHIVQFSKLEKEMPQIIRYLLGEQVPFALMGLYLPFWYIEGDAVCVETALTGSGSARNPSFFMRTRARLVEDKPFSFSKSYLGSFKHYVPDFYEMGYLMTAGSRHIYQKTIWDEVLTSVAKRPFTLTAFNYGLKTSVGIGKSELFDTVYSYFQNMWREFDSALYISYFKVLTPSIESGVDYNYVSNLNDYHYFALKTSFDKPPHFVLIDTLMREQKIYTPGIIPYKSLSAKDSIVVWSEIQPHLRWGNANKTVLKYLNLNSHNVKKYSLCNNVFAPTLSPDNNRILFLDVDDLNNYCLKIYDLSTDKIVWTFSTLDNIYFISPVFSKCGKYIVSVLSKNNTNAIGLIDIENSTINIVLPFSSNSIYDVLDSDESVYFVAGYTGINNLYSVNKSTGAILQHTSSRYGIAQPAIINDDVFYSDYSINGYRLVKCAIDSLMNTPINIDSVKYNCSVLENLIEQERGEINFGHVDTNRYSIEKYSKAKNLINIHSWGPFYLDVDNAVVMPGLSFMSQNILSTSLWQAGYKYNLDQKDGSFFSNYKYLGWFPVIESNLEYGKKDAKLLYQVGNDTLSINYSWHQADASLIVNTPLNISRGKYFSFIKPYIGYNYSKYWDYEIPNYQISDKSISYWNAGVFASYYLRKGYRDLLPNFGAFLNYNYRNVFNQSGYMFMLRNIFYLPGIMPNHGIKLSNSFQHKRNNVFLRTNYIANARGYEPVLNKQMASFQTDYVFPLAYPDWEMGTKIYLKRIKAGLFYDWAFVKHINNPNDDFDRFDYMLHSAGLDVTFDIYFFQLIAPFELGLRSAYLINTQKPFFELIFGFSIEMY